MTLRLRLATLFAKTAVFVLVVGFLTSADSVAAEEPSAMESIHRGVIFGAFRAQAGADLDTPPVPMAQAIRHLQDAHDLLFAKSQASAAAIDRLKQAGEVLIIYDPAFPERALTNRTIAAFFPDYLKDRSAAHTSLVVVGRYGIHWPVDELAVVLAHELLGHGIQHLEGRIWSARVLDIECEAFLWTERAYQDLAVDKRQRSVIDMRRTIERHWCAGFIRWSATHQPAINVLWKTEDPDIDALTAGFARYAESLKGDADTKAAVANDARARAARDPTSRAQLAQSGDAADIYAAGRAYQRDSSAPDNLQTALRLFEKAAGMGHVEAQYRLGLALYRDVPGAPDTDAARRWLQLAADNGHRRAAAILRLIPKQ